MTKYIVLSILTFALVMGVDGQRKEIRKGPEAKNYKPWADAKPSEAEVKPIVRVTGPEAKNAKAWKEDKPSSAGQEAYRKKRITGPEAKNKKPWD